MRELDRFASRTLPGTSGASNPFFSPDGEWLAFSAGGALKKVALAGGDPVRLCDAAIDTPGGGWGLDGFVYFTPSWSSGLWRVSEQGGEPQRVTEPDATRGETTHFWPSFLPDGRSAIVTVFGGAGMRDAKIGIVDLATGEVETLAPGGGVQYVASGHLVFFRHGAWLAAPFDAHRRTITGPERRVLAAARPLSPIGGRERAVSFSDDGRLAYIAAPHSFFTPHTGLAWIDRQGRIEPLPFDGQHAYNSLDLSPDGRRAAVTLATEGEVQAWVYDLERGTRERLTRDGQNLSPRWLPDGSRLAITSLVRGIFDLRLVSAGGLAPPVDLVTSPRDDNRADWTPDAQEFVYEHSSAGTGIDIWARRVDDTGTGRPLVVTPYDDTRPRLSPDGRWLLFESQSMTYVTDFPAARERIQVAEGGAAAWSPSTAEIFALVAGNVVAVRYDASRGRFRVLDSQILFAAPRLPILGDFAVAPDARRFLFFVPVPGTILDPELRVVTDGFAELRSATESR